MATADLKRRTGGDSYIFIGRQKKYGEHITGDEVFWGKAPDWSDLNAIDPRLIRRRLIFTRNTLDPTSETADSESITGANAAVPPIITSRSGGGEWEFEVLPEDAIHLLLGWFNPENLPTPTALADQTLPSAKIDVQAIQGTGAARTQKIVFTNDADTMIADWPGRLDILFPTGSTLDGTGKIVINGEQRRSRSNKFNAQTFETLSGLDADDLKDATKGALSTKFYRKINELVLSGFSAFAAPSEDPTLKFLPQTKYAELTLHPLSALFDGWSSQMVKASESFIAYDIVPDSFRFTVSATSMRLSLTLLASFVQEGRVLIKPLHIAYKLPIYDRPPNANTGDLADYETAAKSSDNNYNNPNDANYDPCDPTKQSAILACYGFKNTDFYPSYGTAVFIGEPGQEIGEDENTVGSLKKAIKDGTVEPIPITNWEIVGSHNYTNAEGFTGDPVGGEPVTDENQTRTVNVNATVVHRTDTTIDNDNETVFWQDRYFEGQYVPIIAHNYNWNGPGRQSLIESEMPRCRLTAVPGLPIEGSGQVNRQLAFEAYPSLNSAVPNEIKMIFYSEEGYQE